MAEAAAAVAVAVATAAALTAVESMTAVEFELE
jgi:hypothetical protein